MIAVYQLQPQVRVRHSFTGAGSLQRKATVFTNCWRVKPHGGALMLYDGPEQWREGELSRQHPYHRLVGGVAVAVTR